MCDNFSFFPADTSADLLICRPANGACNSKCSLNGFNKLGSLNSGCKKNMNS